jgi:hypothetical protein
LRFVDFLDAVAKRDTLEALSIYTVALIKSAERGVSPDEVLDASFEEVCYIVSNRYQIPGWDMTVWGAGFVGSREGVRNPSAD